jgi:ABC-type phosphate transport system ATPase subunit
MTWDPLSDADQDNEWPLTSVRFKNYSLTSGYLSPLKDVTFTVKKGSACALVGTSGSGKSMLLSVLSQAFWEVLESEGSLVQSGVAKVLGVTVSLGGVTAMLRNDLMARIALVTDHSFWLPLSIGENFRLAQRVWGVEDPVPYGDILDGFKLSSRNRLLMRSLEELMPKQVEQPLLQELAIIRALLRKPELLLLDEPFVKMDPVLLKQAEELILNVSEDTTVIWATNDLHQASRVTDMTVFLRNGRTIESTPTAQFFTNPQTRAAEMFVAGKEED